MPGSLSVTSWKPVLRSCAARAGEATPDLDHIALGVARPAQQLDRILAGSTADTLVVATDELGDAVGIDVAVEDDDRNAGIDRLLPHHRRQPRRFLGRDEQHVDALADEVLDVGHLLLGLVLAIGNDQLDLGMLLGFLLHVLVELDPPRLENRRRREADPIFRGCANAPRAGKAAMVIPAAAGLDQRPAFHACSPSLRWCPVGPVSLVRFRLPLRRAWCPRRPSGPPTRLRS